MRHCFFRCGVFFLLGVLVLSIGCSGSRKKAAQIAKNQSRIKYLASMYNGFVAKSRGQVPPDEQSFKQYIREIIAERPPEAKPLDAEEIFISERDQKPYVVLYGDAAKSGPRGGPAGLPVVIYEQDGVDGRRYVASSIGAVDEVDEECFQKLIPSRK